MSALAAVAFALPVASADTHDHDERHHHHRSRRTVEVRIGPCIVIGSGNCGGHGEEISDSDIVDVIACYGGDDNDSRSGACSGRQQSGSGSG